MAAERPRPTTPPRPPLRALRGERAAGPTPGAPGAPARGSLRYQLLSYATVGISNVIVTLGVLNALIALGLERGTPLLAANGVAVGAAICNSYVWNSLVTFRSGALLRGELFARFLVVNLAGFAVNQVVFAVASSLLLGDRGLDPHAGATLAQSVAIVATFATNFAGLRLWAYRARPAVTRLQRPPGGAGIARADLGAERASVLTGQRTAGVLRRVRSGGLAYTGTAGVLVGYGWYSSAVLGMANGDGTARVAQAFAAVFGRDPHLGALSLIWPPIPALIDIVFVVLLRPFGHAFSAGAVMGGLTMAGAIVLLYRVVRELGGGRALAWGLTLAFATHQHVYQSAAAGLSEAPFALCLLGSLLAYLRWARTEHTGQLALAGFLAAGATMSRYEGAFWVAGMGAAIWLRAGGHAPLLRAITRVAPPAGSPARGQFAPVVAFLMPAAFAVMLWMLINAQIMHDPLHFLTGPGSTRSAPDTAAVFGPQHPLAYAHGSIEGTLRLAWARLALVSPLLLAGSAALAVYALRRRSLEAAALALVAWSVVAFPVLTGYQGALPPWIRYWYWAVPMGCVVAAYLVARVPDRRARAVVAVATVALAFLPNVRIFADTYAGVGFPPHPEFTRADRLRNALLTTPDLSYVQDRQAAVREYRAVAATIDRRTPPDALVLLDVVGPGGPIPMLSAHPDRLVTTTDRDFDAAFLDDPQHTVQFVVVPYPTFDLYTRSVVLQRHDGIWDGRPWLRLVEEVPGPTRWRLYEVVPSGAGATGAR